MKYKIWSIEHEAWWSPKSFGYTSKLSLAGEYKKKEAEEICRSANQHGTMNECMIPIRMLEVKK